MTLKQVTMKDAEFLLALKNDLLVRKNSIVTHEEIKLENHLFWLANKLNEKGVRFFILMDQGHDVGDMRVEADGEVSVRIVKEYRGKGLASEALKLMHGSLYAKIVEGNIPSMNLFIRNGFWFTDYKKGVYLLKR